MVLPHQILYWNMSLFSAEVQPQRTLSVNSDHVCFVLFYLKDKLLKKGFVDMLGTFNLNVKFPSQTEADFRIIAQNVRLETSHS